MKIPLIIVFSLSVIPVFFSSPGYTGADAGKKPTAEEQAAKMCNCLKAAEKSGKREERGKCLELQEKLVKELGDDKEAHKKFKELQRDCMQEIADARYGITFSADKTYDEKLKEVCDCSKTARSGDDRSHFMYCLQLQSRYAATFGEDTTTRKKFNIESQSCE